MNDLNNLASVGNILIGIMLLIGGYVALRNGKHRQAGEIQSQVIAALQAELDALQHRIEALEKENARLNHIMNLMKSALRKRGLTVSIDGDLVTIDDTRGNSSHYSHIQREEEK
jgi:cell division protein FtsB